MFLIQTRLLHKQHNINTSVMGASFRNVGEIEALAGCDRLTIGPTLLTELAADNGHLERKLSPDSISSTKDRITITETSFLTQMSENTMATEKLASGIHHFTKDQVSLESLLAEYYT